MDENHTETKRLQAELQTTEAHIELLEQQRAELLVAAAALTPAQLEASLAALRREGETDAETVVRVWEEVKAKEGG